VDYECGTSLGGGSTCHGDIRYPETHHEWCPAFNRYTNINPIEGAQHEEGS
jgi:hypothetical protein